jgi:hypothetical protein
MKAFLCFGNKNFSGFLHSDHTQRIFHILFSTKEKVKVLLHFTEFPFTHFIHLPLGCPPLIFLCEKVKEQDFNPTQANNQK